MNRIQVLIETIAQAVERQVVSGVRSQEYFDERRKALAITLDEYFSLQQAKSVAQASGKLTYDEALTVYALLDGGLSRVNSLGYAQLATLSIVHSNLLQNQPIGTI